MTDTPLTPPRPTAQDTPPTLLGVLILVGVVGLFVWGWRIAVHADRAADGRL